MKRATKMDKFVFVVIEVLVLIVSILSDVNGHLYVGHLTNGDVNVPSQDIANCISKFLSCTDDKSEGDLMKTSNNCYHDFQSCSGSDIEISQVPDVSDSSNFDCKDAKGMYYPSPFDCQSYYQCMDSNGPPMKLSCPNDLQFNPIMQKCDDPSKVATVKPECVKSFTSNNNVVSKLSKEPKVLVVPSETIGLSRDVKNAVMNNKEDISIQTVFDKLFGFEADSANEIEDNTEDRPHKLPDKTDIILGALRNVLLVCEICKSKTRHLIVPSTTSPPVMTDTMPTTKRSRKLEITTHVPIALPQIKCEYGNWTISDCTTTCGNGTRQSTRELLSDSPFGNLQPLCIQKESKIEPCDLDPCPSPNDECLINGGEGGDEPGKQCLFPFSYKGITYTECTTFENNGIHWCSTEVDTIGNYIEGKWGNCNSKCPTAIPSKYVRQCGIDQSFYKHS